MNEEDAPRSSTQALPVGEVVGSGHPGSERSNGEFPGRGEEKAPETAAKPDPRPARQSRPIRRVPKPRMTGLLDSPVRNLTVGVIYTILVMIGATVAYMAVGWSFRDALYMVIITIYTVGFGEVRPINTPALNVITIALIMLGCTGIIFLTGALVQFITLSQLNKVMGLKRMNSQIDQLKGHVVVCGFGRLGNALAKTLSASSAGFVVLEYNESRAEEARAQGYLCIHGDATTEAALIAVGIMRAHALATVLSNDALNVFITLSARALNPPSRSSLAASARAPRASSSRPAPTRWCCRPISAPNARPSCCSTRNRRASSTAWSVRTASSACCTISAWSSRWSPRRRRAPPST
jgi:TrkA-N domain/Ion channel